MSNQSLHRVLAVGETKTENLGVASRVVLFCCSVVMVGVSLYLLDHYFEAHFPTKLVSKSMCDVSSFWNCDTATFSPLSSLFQVPIAAFGVPMGLIFLVASLWSNRRTQDSNIVLASANALGCLCLGMYSLIVLDGLCPGCTIYYLVSWVACAVLLVSAGFKFRRPSAKVFAVYLILFTSVAVGVRSYVTTKEEKMAETVQHLLKDFRDSPNYESVAAISPHRLASSHEIFTDAPLRVSLFSDFQCPVCKVFSEQVLQKLIRHYRGKLNLQYFFYPMDSNCNHNVGAPMHPMACEASYLASCAGDKFEYVHDQIYARQNELKPQVLQKIANDQGLSTCYNSQAAKDSVEAQILAGDRLGVAATPTMYVNGRKLEGLLPLKFLIMLFDDALASSSS